MNRLQHLFNVDERLVLRDKSKERRTSLAYCLFAPSQWRYVRRWLGTHRESRSPIEDGVAWVTYGAQEFLGQIITGDFRLLEYGSGGSTVFYSVRCREVICVEHNPYWLDLVSTELERREIRNCTLRYLPPTLSDDTSHDYFRSLTEPDVSFSDYVQSIADYPDDHFDLVSADGRSRVACVREAYSKVKDGGWILLDNSDRPDYFEASLFMRDKDATQTDFFGLVGYETPLSQTTIWRVNK